MNGSIQLGRMIVNNFYKINNWSELQERQKANQSTPWIKVHSKLLNDLQWNKLDDMAKALYIELQLLASENLGHLNDIDDISFRLRRNITHEIMNQLIPYFVSEVTQEEHEAHQESFKEILKSQKISKSEAGRKGAEARWKNQEYDSRGQVKVPHIDKDTPWDE